MGRDISEPGQLQVTEYECAYVCVSSGSAWHCMRVNSGIKGSV